MSLTIHQIALGDRRLKQFVDVPWVLFRGDPNWTPPLRADLLGSRLLGMTGLLTPEHPYHQDAEVTHFVACDGKRLLGRVSAAVNHRFNDHYQDKVGFFGFFDVCEDYAVACELLDRARAWIAERDMRIIRGPGGYSNATHESHQGVLIDGFEHPPTIELTHNPPYYGEFLERYGLAKAKDYVAYRIDIEKEFCGRRPRASAAPYAENEVTQRLERIAASAHGRRQIETWPIDMGNLLEEVDHIVRIYNEAWANNWGFLPMTEAEGKAIAASLKLVADPGLLRFASVNGELAAVLGALPDPNVPFRPRWNRLADTDLARALRLLRTRRRIPSTRLMFFGVRPKFRRLGIDAVLYLEVLEHAIRRGYQSCEPSLLLEDNDLILRASASMGGTCYKRWRIYEMAL